jgi:uncharacterized BrkB/YihY/UPF0761 family membrane protein
MVTLVFTTLLLITILFNACIDMYLHKIGLAEALSHLYDLDFGTGRWLLMIQLAIGLAFSLLSDRRRRKKKQQQNQQSEDSQKQQA